MKSLFRIMQQVSPATNRPFRINETVFTSDGPRDRICDGAWYTQQEAEAALKRHQQAPAINLQGDKE